MIKPFLQINLVFILAAVSCKAQSGYGKPVMTASVILKSQANFAQKYYPVLNLDDEFSALDENAEIIDKNIFFERLLTGTYLPVKLNSKTNTYYQLYKMDTTVADKSISATIKSLAYYSYEHFKMEGKTLPDFNFTDLENNKYNNETVNGKIVVIKFWFIHCQRCVEEMPYLNKVVKKYENRKDIVFLSLAYDEQEELKKFLTKTAFDFAVVANQKEYLTDTLKIKSYPTYFILNKSGTIVKAVGSDKDMEAALQREISK